MNRRSFLRQSGAFAGLGLAGLAGCGRRGSAPASGGMPALPFYDAMGPIVPIRAHVDRIFRTTVCLRPFRAAGSWSRPVGCDVIVRTNRNRSATQRLSHIAHPS